MVAVRVIALVWLFLGSSSLWTSAFIPTTRRPSTPHGLMLAKDNALHIRHSQRLATPKDEDAATTLQDESIMSSKKQPDDIAAPTNFSTTVSFPSYNELMALRPGECVVSDPFEVTSSFDNKTYSFCVKLYPRGGGHSSSHTVQDSKEKSGFGMSYKVLPMFGGRQEEKVGAYLQYLPSDDNESVDASFGLRLKGRQKEGRKFDVEWRAGMRFVSLSQSQLMEGKANDFGAHLMQTMVLSEFLGIPTDQDYLDQQTDTERLEQEAASPLQMEVDVTLHERPQETKSDAVLSNGEDRASKDNQSLFSSGFGILAPRDIRGTTDPSQHDTEQVRVGRVVVPILQRLSQRPKMFQMGAYPGVEYRILRIIDPKTDQDLFYSRPGADYELKPIYPLVSELERPWPVRVNENDIPRLFTPTMYNTVSAIGSLFTAGTGLLFAFVVSLAVSLFFIPSRSMDPTLLVGDVILVNKVTPRVASLLGQPPKPGDIVLFHPPDKLQEIVKKAGGRAVSDRDLFVKRVSAKAGDEVSVDKQGNVRINGKPDTGNRNLCTAEPLRLIERYIEPSSYIVPKGNVLVLGDCGSVSVDSRVWGPLSTSEIVGRPIVRLWPTPRFGEIPALPTADPTLWTDEER